MYSIVGMLIASFIFRTDPALPAIAFTSLLLLPELYKIFSIEERQERMEERVSFKALWRDDVDVVKIYIWLFLGILLVYSVGTIVLPEFQTNSLFREQLELRFGQGFAGNAFASFDSNLFFGILSNNFVVLLACFGLALLTGDGAIFFITWNASVWGAIFGITAKHAGAFSGNHPFLLFGAIMMIVFCHMIIEALSYFLAAISGSLISKDVLLEEFASSRFMEVLSFNLYLFFFALVFLLLGSLVETVVLIVEIPIVAFAMIVLPILAILLLLKYTLIPKEHHNHPLATGLTMYFIAFGIGLGIMIFLNLPTFDFSATTYRDIIEMSRQVVRF